MIYNRKKNTQHNKGFTAASSYEFIQHKITTIRV